MFLSSSKVEAALDTGFGTCWMRDDRIAELVANALGHFDGDKYRLFAWCVIPNHVHAVIQPLEEYELSKILHSWKSFTGNTGNKNLNRSGEFWHREYCDHLIRNEQDLICSMEYVIGNPYKAELQDWEWTGFGDGWL
jgi:REP element-mobilizing transposase RayT